jgi:hypothetical protein
MQKFAWAALSLVFALCAAAPAAADTRLFSDSSEIAITLEGPLSTIQRTARNNTDPHAGVVTLSGAQGQRFDVQIAARGHVRRMGGFCSLPPLRLTFDRDQVRGTLFEGQHRLKLVAPCRPGDSYQQLIVLEYLAYGLYNQVTAVSFRARPVRVTYRDADAHGREVTRLGFLLEDDDDVAERNHRHALEVQTRAVSPEQLDPDLATRAALFEYMIGNLDWDMLASQAGQSCCHNFVLMAPSRTSRERVAPTPYDFDYSGLVNAPYAMPPEGIRISSVRVRYYRGYCRFNDQLPGVIADLRARRQAFYHVVDSEPLLSDGPRRGAHRYLDDFFAVLDDPARVDRELTRHCRSG